MDRMEEDEVDNFFDAKYYIINNNFEYIHAFSQVQME